MFSGFFVGTDAHVAAEYFGIRPGSFPAVIFIVGGNGKQGGVNAGQGTYKVGVFVSAEVDVDAHFFFVKLLYFLFDKRKVLG